MEEIVDKCCRLHGKDFINLLCALWLGAIDVYW